jgi:hypothetical protein
MDGQDERRDEATRGKDALRIEAAQDRRVARVTCGWCNRVLGTDPDGVPRYLTCDECRGLLPASGRVA